MDIIERTTAGSNEKKFKELMSRTLDVKLLGKRKFVCGNVQISVDESLEHDGIEYLIEIDSANMAKLLVGQYVLLNQLHTSREKSPFFLIVHTYKKFNPQRTLRNLELINQQLYRGEGIEFGAVHFEALQAWSAGFPEFLSLVQRPTKILNGTETK
ncbi:MULTISPECIES: hypothetical protein [unclassified Pseudomonas]|uniref:hypothetical protein n=1 Tax=unclassified Pseudomonas TaxID=196821 RepID=UPI00132EC240|nr:MULTISPECIES: hypothetical protein [unclassified Pseudomonas]QHF52454.1 hypothetical protein PspS49_23480 [Pseudomonas sp. S49]WNZ83154.1 hypothetical protein QOM10_23100 [Pseudomonas sp. P108]